MFEVISILIILVDVCKIQYKIPTMTEEEQLALLASDGMLVKRPILVNGNDVLIGFKLAEYEEKGL